MMKNPKKLIFAFFTLAVALSPLSSFAQTASTTAATPPLLIGCEDENGANAYWLNDGFKKMTDALQITVSALEHENDPSQRKILSQAFADIFKGTIDSSDWLTVKNMILSVAPHVMKESVFQCDAHNKVMGCKLLGAPAFTPTSREKVILCKKTLADASYMSGVLMHESMHRFGGAGIDYIGELYCADWEKAQPPTARLIRTPDAYMKFIYQVAQHGTPFDWLPCYVRELRESTSR